MARPKTIDSDSSKAIPVRFGKKHLEAIETASKRYELSKQEVIRLTSKAGLKALERLTPAQLIDFIAKEIK